MVKVVDVVVVGAGLAGLTLAWRLQQAGVRVVLLEARRRVGGRVYGFDVNERTVQLGGRWTGPGQDAIKRLAAELGVHTRANETFGNSEAPRRFDDDFRAGVERIDHLANTVSLEEPWQTPKARELDSVTLHSWLVDNLGLETGDRIARLLTGFFPEATDVSLLHGLFYLASNGGLARIFGIHVPAHDSELFEGGAHQLTTRLAERLGERVVLDHPVSLVTQNETGVTVADYTASQCVIAMPPVLAGRLRYEPAMPAARDYLTQRMPIRGKIAFALLYGRAFWRDHHAPLLIVNDRLTLWDEGGEDRPYSLHGLISIPWSRVLGVQTETQRRVSITEELVDILGRDIRSPIGYHDVDWAAEPWSRGCNSFMTTGVWTVWGHALRESVGRIHFAGAEMSPLFYGQMDGALRSAEATARKILDGLV